MFLNIGARKPASWARQTLVFLGAAALIAAPATAQDVETFDPDDAYASSEIESAGSGAIDGDLVAGESTAAPSVAPPLEGQQSGISGNTGIAEEATDASPGFDEEFASYSENGQGEGQGETSAPESEETVASAEADSQTYGEDDLIGAAEGVFGKGAEGLAKMIQDLLKDQGEPNGYIVGREAGGAFIFGARYGSGTLYHKVEGQRKVYWTGPSIGFDAGANAANTFVLVYNLFDTEDLYKRFPAGEGQAYLIGGLHASYMRKGDIVLIPVRMGAGVRLGVNAGYMKFSKKQRWLPF